MAASERKGLAATLAGHLLMPLLVISLLLMPLGPACMLETAWAWNLPSLPGRPTSAGQPQPLAPAAPTGRLQEVPPPAAVQQLQQALAEHQPQITISSPRDGATLSDGPWTLKLKLRDWPLTDAGPLGLGAHLVVQIDDLPPQRITAGEGQQAFMSSPQRERELVLQQAPLTPGSHRLTVYAARPWGEAVKSPGAVRQIRLHRLAANPLSLPAPGTPQLLPVSPEASNAGEPLLLDWLLLDAPLQNLRNGDASWRLKVTINGDTFVVDQAEPLWLRGWKSGRNILQLELVDGIGDPLNPPFNSFVEAIDLAAPGADPAAKPRWLQGRLSTDELAVLLGDTPPPQPQPEPEPDPEAEARGDAENQTAAGTGPETENEAATEAEIEIEAATKIEADTQQKQFEPGLTDDSGRKTENASASDKAQGEASDAGVNAATNTTLAPPMPDPTGTQSEAAVQELEATAEPSAEVREATIETRTSDQGSGEQARNGDSSSAEQSDPRENSETEPNNELQNDPENNSNSESETESNFNKNNEDTPANATQNSNANITTNTNNSGSDDTNNNDKSNRENAYGNSETTGNDDNDTNESDSIISDNKSISSVNNSAEYDTVNDTINGTINDTDNDAEKAADNFDEVPMGIREDSGNRAASAAQRASTSSDSPQPAEVLLGGSARDLVNPDGTLIKAAPQGPLSKLRQLLQR